jgi:D-3-phosphoglycerate dehydrogenase
VPRSTRSRQDDTMNDTHAAAANRRVVRFAFRQDPAFAATLEAAGVALTTVPLDAPEEAAWAALEQAEVYQVSSARDELMQRFFVTDALLARCPRLHCISANGAGFDTVDVAACTRAGVLVVNQAGSNAVSVAEHTLGFMLDLGKRLTESDRQLRAARGYAREDLMGREISGRVLGLIGIGHVGTRVAALARAFGMRVLAHDPLLDPAEVARRGAEPVAFDALLAEADVVSIHCPRDATTKGMMNAAAFARMKRGAWFLNTARGGIHDEAALHAALVSGQVGGAGLDVWDVEPPPLDHPLLKLPNVIATFHTAGVTVEARRAMAAWSAEQILGLFRGEKPPRLVNPEAWSAWLRRFN